MKRAALALVLFVALAGCGGESGSGATVTPTTEPPATTAAPITTETATNQTVACGGYPANTSSLECHPVNGSGYVEPTGFDQ